MEIRLKASEAEMKQVHMIMAYIELVKWDFGSTINITIEKTDPCQEEIDEVKAYNNILKSVAARCGGNS